MKPFVRARASSRPWAASIALTAIATAAVGLAAPPAQAATPVSPGSFTGFAFDTCAAPANAVMDAWLTSSPYWGVGVYLGGAERGCAQANLNAAWVSRQSSKGWKVLPIWVGPQASCANDHRDPADPPFSTLIDPDPTTSYAAAWRQGVREAESAAGAARGLGIAAGSTLWYDLEDFGLADAHCRRSALTFLSAWTQRLHRLGFRSGVYSNVAAAIDALDYADTVSPGSYAMPDQIWYAWANGRADTVIDRRWVRGDNWTPHARIHQYRLDASATYGGARMLVDSNYLDVGRGSVAPRPAATCGVNVNLADYVTLGRGRTGPQVKALQCLLRQKRVYSGKVTGRYDLATYRAVRAYQRRKAIRVTGRTDVRTWTVLLTDGPAPLLKQGSASEAVRRLQRGLTAALDQPVRVTGVFTTGTTNAVKRYQRARSLPVTGVMATDTWRQLRAGRR